MDRRSVFKLELVNPSSSRTHVHTQYAIFKDIYVDNLHQVMRLHWGSRTVESHLKMATKETSETKIIFSRSAHVDRQRIPTLFIKQFDTLSCSKGGDPTSKPDFNAGEGSLTLSSAGTTTQSAAQPSDATRYSPRLQALLIFPRLAQRKLLKPADPLPTTPPPQTPRPASRFSPRCCSNGCKKRNLFGWQ